MTALPSGRGSKRTSSSERRIPFSQSGIYRYFKELDG